MLVALVVDEASSRWRKLVTRYQVECHKQLSSPEDATAKSFKRRNSVAPSSWPLMTHMQFLTDSLTELHQLIARQIEEVSRRFHLRTEWCAVQCTFI